MESVHVSHRYVVEQRLPPNANWERIGNDIQEPKFKVNKYNKKKDYYFRVKAVNEVGSSEPSMPAMLRRKDGMFALS